MGRSDMDKEQLIENLKSQVNRHMIALHLLNTCYEEGVFGNQIYTILEDIAYHNQEILEHCEVKEPIPPRPECRMR